ncbi:hypothetical protein C7S20_00020 [Christiangramia fulva]|uniref:Dystroglycan-type cadherin-like domain-containing protein n=1 Tax=Christiangramia fulva TaxID=2126553 RepID=A0A2R3Z0K5_9FLAO|nr:hypothetical protein [Christiangramia fulva]AVR43784.1 hypothetical protein C7S20_00020 [Christiangramia fulva]
MTIADIKAKITAWIRTGIPNNVKSSNVRTLLSWLAIRVDVQETGRLRIIKISGNTSEDLQKGDKVTGIVEDTFMFNGVYLGGDINLLSSYSVNNYATIADLYPTDRLLESSYKWKENYTYTVLWVRYVKNGVINRIDFNQDIPLDAPDAQDRIDRIVFNIDTLSLEVVKGDPAPVPSPKAINENQKQITFVPVKTGTTQPEGVGETVVYAENAQELGGEFDTSVSDASIDPNNAEDPATGSKAIKFNNVPNLAYLDLDTSTAFSNADASLLVLSIKCINNKKHKLAIEFRTQAGTSLSSFNLEDGVLGFDRSNLTDYQVIAIPLDGLSITNSDRIRITNLTTGSSLFIDDILIQKGTPNTTTSGAFLPTGGFVGTAQELKDQIDAIGANPGVTTVTGDGVDNTDPDNPVLSFPNADQVDDSSTTNKFVTQAEKDKLAAISNPILLKGQWDPNSGAFPSNVKAGWSYIVSGTATVDGIEFGIKDRIIALVDNASTTTYADNWFHDDYSDTSYQSELTTAGTKATPVDADIFGYLNSAASNILVKFTWANIKTALENFFNPKYQKIKADYGTVQNLFDNQSEQFTNEQYTILDATGWNDGTTTITSGWATVKYNGGTAGDESDYDLREYEQGLEFSATANQYGQHPAFSSQNEAIIWLLGNAVGEAPNNAPTISGVPDVTQTEGYSSFTVDLSAYSSDPDGDALTYDASSADTNLATVSVSGSILTVTEVAGSGTVNITVTVDDGLATGQDVFLLTVDAAITGTQLNTPTGMTAQSSGGDAIDIFWNDTNS